MEKPSEIKSKYNDFIKIVDEICSNSNDVRSNNIQEEHITNIVQSDLNNIIMLEEISVNSKEKGDDEEKKELPKLKPGYMYQRDVFADLSVSSTDLSNDSDESNELDKPDKLDEQLHNDNILISNKPIDINQDDKIINYLNSIILNDLDNFNTNGETGFYGHTGSDKLSEQNCGDIENIELNTNSDFDKKFEKNSIFIKRDKLDKLNKLDKKDKTTKSKEHKKQVGKKKSSNLSNSSNSSNSSDRDQMERLERIFKKNSETPKPLSDSDKKKKYKDDMKKFSKKFDKECIIESTRGYDLKTNLHYIKLDLLKKNIKNFNSGNYECAILYKNANLSVMNKLLNNSEWYEIDFLGDRPINTTSKFYKTCIKLFESNNKFRKTIGNYKTRAYKTEYLLYGTKNHLDIHVIIKEKKVL
jgi:hypothetical protein